MNGRVFSVIFAVLDKYLGGESFLYFSENGKMIEVSDLREHNSLGSSSV